MKKESREGEINNKIEDGRQRVTDFKIFSPLSLFHESSG